MRIGVPKERRSNEHRVGVTPFGAARLVHDGHEVYVEHDAGADCHFSDEDYVLVGAKVVYEPDEVFQRVDLVCRVGPLDNVDLDAVRPQSAVLGFLHLATQPRDQIAQLMSKGVTLIGYEGVEREGRRTVLVTLAEIAGHLAVHTAAHLLEYDEGGRGLLLGGIPGIPPPTVLVLGAGTAGRAAARLAGACGAHVIILDSEVDRLRRAHEDVSGQPVTALASNRNLKRFTEFADVLVGASLTPSGPSPVMVTEDMVRSMKPGSVVIDLSIGLGGCIETSRPTTLDQPTFQAHGVTHYCVPNITAAVPRTASRAMTLSALPYVNRIAGQGLATALATDPGLARGVYAFRGHAVDAHLAKILGQTPAQLTQLLD